MVKSPDSKLKAHELRAEGKQSLLNKLKNLRSELATLRVNVQTGGAASMLAKIKITRKAIARVLTILAQKEHDQLRKNVYKKNSNKPKFLRPRLTHAKRVELQPYERAIQTLRQVKQAKAWPSRKYAVTL